MGEYKYRLTALKKEEVARNLINILECDELISDETQKFIANWVMSGQEEKTKAFYDVWDIVLRNYMPSSRPTLFRVCSRPTYQDKKIVSFTDSFNAAERFRNGRSFLIICDTRYWLEYESLNSKKGNYRHTFYPLVDAIKKYVNQKQSNGEKTSLSSYIGENEYVMRTELGRMSILKWHKERE